MIFALFNAFAVALNSLAAAAAARRTSVGVVLVVAAPTSLAVALAFLALNPSLPQARGIVLGLVAGLTGGLGILMSYRALAIGPVGMVSAITACVSVVVVSVVGFITQGVASLSRVLAVVLCLVAVFLVTYRRNSDRIAAQAIGLALGAGVILASFSLFMNATEPSDGWWPLVMVRCSVVGVAAGFFLAQRRFSPRSTYLPTRGVWWLLPIVAGTVDTFGNVFLIYALRFADLATVAVIVSVVPALAAFLARIVLKESLSALQVTGIGVAVVALAAVAL